MSKVISFSLWGNNPKYYVGAIRNAELAREIYPGWITRFYCAESISHDTAIAILQHGQGWKLDSESCRIWRSGDDLTEIYYFDGDGDWRNMFDRFLPAVDPNVETMISRDCDSRLSLREKSAVDEWLESDKGFHTIHDHFHHTVPILGGLWGMKRDCLPEFRDLLSQWPQENRLQTDQEFLTQKIWPRVKDNTLNHSEFHTNIWPGQSTPLPRSGREFIGATYNEYDQIDPEQMRCLYG
jgi:hypothetical protein